MNAPINHLAEALGNTLFHSLWQGSLIALVLAVFLAFGRTASPGFRYRICSAAFFVLPLWMTVTFAGEWGKLYNLHHESPRLFPDFPNRYLLDQQLNFLDRNLPIRDPDGDGFNTLEEFRAGTRPNDATSHPDYAGKLKFVARHVQLYRIVFAAQPDQTRFQLNRLPTARWAAGTMIHRMGETTEDGRLRLEKRGGDGIEVTYLATGERLLLPKRQPVDIPTWFGELRFDLEGEKPFLVKQGETFRLGRESGRVWQLVAVEPTGARIREVGSKELRTIGAPGGSGN